MASITVAQFATELKVPPQLLLEQLRAAGVVKKAEEDALSDEDKARLLESLRKAHGAEARREEEDHADPQADDRDQAGRCIGQGTHDPGRSSQEARLRQA